VAAPKIAFVNRIDEDIHFDIGYYEKQLPSTIVLRAQYS
jgi:hypothetical protein